MSLSVYDSLPFVNAPLAYLAKTDAIDARMLAAMGRAVTLKTAEPTDPMRTRLATLHKRRDQLVD